MLTWAIIGLATAAAWLAMLSRLADAWEEFARDS